MRGKRAAVFPVSYLCCVCVCAFCFFSILAVSSSPSSLLAVALGAPNSRYLFCLKRITWAEMKCTISRYPEEMGRAHVQGSACMCEHSNSTHTHFFPPHMSLNLISSTLTHASAARRDEFVKAIKSETSSLQCWYFQLQLWFALLTCLL